MIIRKEKGIMRCLALFLLLAMLVSMLSCNASVPPVEETTTSAEEETTATPMVDGGSIGEGVPTVSPEPEKLPKPANPRIPLFTHSSQGSGEARNCASITVPADYNAGVEYDILATQIDSDKKEIYLFLPCRADLSALTFTVKHYDGTVSGPYTVDFSDEEISLNERIRFSPDGEKNYDSNGRTAGTYTILAYQSNLPTMMVEIDESYVTIGQMNNDPDHKTHAFGDMVTVVTDEMALENGWQTRYLSVDSDPDKNCSADMRGRGNWNWKYPKRSYQVRTENNMDLLGMGIGKTWALLGLWNDCTGIRTQLANDLALNLGVPYTSRHCMIDLFLNGKYKGMYVITEKVEVAPNRVEIDKENDILFEVDQYYEDHGDLGIAYPEYGTEFHFRIHSPETEESIAHSKEILTEALAALHSGDEKEFLKYFDLDSWTRMLLVQVYSMNNDAYAASLFFYYDSTDGKMHACAPWDFDWSFGYAHKSSPSYSDPFVSDFSFRGISEPMQSYPAFLNALLELYYEQGGRDAILDVADLARYYGELGIRTMNMNALGASVNYQKEKTPSAALEFLYDFCDDRFLFMETKMEGIAKELGYEIEKK